MRQTPPSRPGLRSERGSILITALLIATALGLGLAAYLNVSRNALKLSQRTFYLNCASNLAEAGLEEAIYSFRLADAGASLATIWSGWTLIGSNAKLTLPTFSCGQNAVGVVKVFVSGYDGTLTIPSAYVQATVTPIDGSAPITKTLKVTLKKKGSYSAAIITTNSLSLGGQTVVDSFNSNPTGSSNATRLDYPGGGAAARGNVVAYAGSISLSGNDMVNGNLYLGSTVTAPAQAFVNGSIITNYSGQYPTPSLPNFSGGGGYYGLLSFPATLPRSSDTPAADGRYYYYPAFILNPLTLGATTITAGKNVTIVATSVSGGLTLGTDASCIVWTGNVSTSGSNRITNPNWAGALQIYSWGTSVSLGHDNDTSLCLYAPLATMSLSGGGSSPSFTGSIVARNFSASGQWAIHYDESLNNISTPVGTGWTMTKWYDLAGTSEAGTLDSLTGGFLD